MKKLMIVFLILMACEDFSLMPEFPEYGFYGLNILNEKITEVEVGEDYSMAVNILNGNLHLELINQSPDSCIWYYSINSKSGWLMGEYSDSIQECKASINSDLLIMFQGAGSMKINYFWNGDLLTIKEINW